MIRLALIALLALAACKEDRADAPPPVELTAEAVGHFCQMDLIGHPGPKAQVHLDGLPFPLFFSQVRDALAYARMPEQSHIIAAIYVNDLGAAPSWEEMGAENWIAAGAAHYVIGSDRAGGMGAPEAVPFTDAGAAQAFAARHGGTAHAVVSGEAFLTEPGEFSSIVSNAIEIETALRPELSTSGGTSDARFLKDLCPVIEFGLSNATMHKRDEAVALADLEVLARIYRRITEAALA